MGKQVPLFILLLFLVRPICIGATIADAIMVFCLTLFYACYAELNKAKETPLADEAFSKIKDLEEELKVTKESVYSLKLGAGLRR